MSGFDWRAAGLYAALVAQSGGIRQLRVAEWQHATEDGTCVGTCRVCGGLLIPDTPPRYRGDPPLRWYVARCLSCAQEFASPDGRLGRRLL